MITQEFTNGNTHNLKNRWEELTAAQYIAVLDFITIFMSGMLSLVQFRARVFLELTGLKMRLHHDTEKADRQCENIYHLSRHIVFPLLIRYKNEKAFSKLKKDVREKLSRYMPGELEQTPEVRWAEKAEKEIVPDLVFARNLVPVIGRRRHTLKGYTFDVDDNILLTSLTTTQFLDAQTVAAEIHETGKESLLNLLVAILYCPGDYNSQQAHNVSKNLDWLDLATKKAIFINFNAIQSFLYTQTKYAILFNEPTTSAKPKHNLGLGSVAHSLIKSGYSGLPTSNLVEFFEIMYSELVSNVTSLHRQGVTLDKIAEQTGLPISKINQVL